MHYTYSSQVPDKRTADVTVAQLFVSASRRQQMTKNLTLKEFTRIDLLERIFRVIKSMNYVRESPLGDLGYNGVTIYVYIYNYSCGFLFFFLISGTV